MAHPPAASVLVNRIRGVLEGNVDPEKLAVLVEEIDLIADERQESSGEVRISGRVEASFASSFENA